MKSITFRSAGAGAILSAIVLLSLGADNERPNQSEQPNQVAHTAHGRFQGFATHTTAYVIDTATGRVWREGEKGFSGEKVKLHKF